MGKAEARARRLGAPKEAKGPSFRFFLKGRRDREDDLGALARFVLFCKGDLPANNLFAYRALLQERGYADAMVAALEDAWAEYEQSRRA